MSEVYPPVIIINTVKLKYKELPGGKKFFLSEYYKKKEKRDSDLNKVNESIFLVLLYLSEKR